MDDVMDNVGKYYSREAETWESWKVCFKVLSSGNRN